MRRALANAASSLLLLLLLSTTTTTTDAAPYGPGMTAPALPFAFAEPEEVGMSSQHLQKATQAVKDLVDQRKVAGASFAVMRHGKIVAMESFGYQNYERRVPMGNNTIFRVFSQSKPISTAAFLTLIDEGRVHLDDPVSLYLPEFATVRVYSPTANSGKGGTVPLERPMTIRHLLTHTAGLTYGFMDNTPVDQMYNEAYILNPHEGLDAKVKRLAKLPLTNQPGAKWNYGLSTDILILIASKVTGLTIDGFMQERLFGPLGMTDSGFYVPKEKADRLATVYQRDATGFHQPPPDPNNIQLIDYTKKPAYLAAGGGLLTSLPDMMKFGQMMVNGGELNGVRILRPETVAAMTRAQVDDSLLPLAYSPTIVMREITFGYGIGIQIPYTDDGKGNIQVMRPGEYSWGGGMSTNFWCSPTDETVIVTMVQIIPFTEDLKFAVRDWTYRAIDAYARAGAGGPQGTGIAISPFAAEKEQEEEAAVVEVEVQEKQGNIRRAA